MLVLVMSSSDLGFMEPFSIPSIRSKMDLAVETIGKTAVLNARLSHVISTLLLTIQP